MKSPRLHEKEKYTVEMRRICVFTRLHNLGTSPPACKDIYVKLAGQQCKQYYMNRVALRGILRCLGESPYHVTLILRLLIIVSY